MDMKKRIIRVFPTKTNATPTDELVRIRETPSFFDEADEAYRCISDCILLEAPQRSYNIVLSLCRIISSLNGRISGRYDFNPAKPLVRIPALLECTGIEDCKIDEIIELNLTD